MRLSIPAAILISMATSARASVWTVDDSGGANFTTIQAAVNAAADGDVILVKPGGYPGFTVLGKSLGILGVPDAVSTAKPSVVGKTMIQSVADTTLANMKFNTLTLFVVTGTAVLDDVACETSFCDFGASMKACPRVLVSRSVFTGKWGDINCETPALYVEDSKVNLTLCTLHGGHGGYDGCYGYDGQPGLVVGPNGKVLLAQSGVHGASGGNGGFDCGPGGDGGSAITMLGPGSSCVVRGNSDVMLTSGGGGSGLFSGSDAQYAVEGNGDFSISEVPYSPGAFGPGIHATFPLLRSPFFTLTGGDAPNSPKTLSVYASPGSSHLVLVTIGYAGAFAVPPQVEGLLYLSIPGSVIQFPMNATGLYAPASVTFSLPSDFTSLHGTIANFQGLSQGFGASGNWLAGNPVPLVIR